MRTEPKLTGATLWGLLTAASVLVAAGAAQAGGFGVREQSVYFQGSAFAGSAAGTDISSMFWNSAATAAKTGCNSSSNMTIIFGRAEESGQAGLFVTGASAPTSTDVGSDAAVPSSYTTCQLTDQLYVGLGMNAPFGIATKSDSPWAGSPIAMTSKVISFDFNPTLAYKLTPELSIGVGLQAEYLSVKLTAGPFDGLLGSRTFDGNDWGFGATAGVLWQPSRATSIGLGYRSAVGVDVNGPFTATPGLLTGPPVATNATGKLVLPDEVTLSARYYLTPPLAVLGTIEWQNWSRLQNVAAVGTGCIAGTCETLNLNYRDGWFYSVGVEYAYNPSLLLRMGVGYELSPIRDSNRDILVPDSNRVHLGIGASYRVTDRITADIGYSHIFFDDAPFCIGAGGGSTHCTASTSVILLSGKADVSTDILGFGLKYKF